MYRKLLIAFSILAGCISAIPAKAQVTRPSQLDPCDRMSSYIILPTGNCSNLSYLSGTGGRALSRQEQKIVADISSRLVRLGIPISHQDCPPGYLGYYHMRSNNMVMCTLTAQFPYYYMTTLVHESVHVVQDLLNGRDNESDRDDLVTIGTRYPALSQEVTQNLSNYKKQEIEKNYADKKEHWPYEQEAWYFMEYPNKVIKLLDMCLADPKCR